jgi:hypothetical protein
MKYTVVVADSVEQYDLHRDPTTLQFKAINVEGFVSFKSAGGNSCSVVLEYSYETSLEIADVESEIKKIVQEHTGREEILFLDDANIWE